MKRHFELTTKGLALGTVLAMLSCGQDDRAQPPADPGADDAGDGASKTRRDAAAGHEPDVRVASDADHAGLVEGGDALSRAVDGARGSSSDNVQGVDPNDAEKRRGRADAGAPGRDANEGDAFAVTAVVLLDSVRIRSVTGGDAGPSSVLVDYPFFAGDGGLGAEGWQWMPGSDVPSGLSSRASFGLDDTGDRDPGSVRLLVPFVNAGERIDFGVSFDPSRDLEGAEIVARLKLDSGGPVAPECAFHAWVYAISDSGSWIGSEDVDFRSDDGWIDIELVLSAPVHPESDTKNFDPSSVARIGLELGTGTGDCG